MVLLTTMIYSTLENVLLVLKVAQQMNFFFRLT